MVSPRKFRPYFLKHEITVLTNKRLKHFLQKPNGSRRMKKLAIELSEFQIKFTPRMNIKGQVLANFTVESTYPLAAVLTETTIEKQVLQSSILSWRLFDDGTSFVEGSGQDLY